MYACFFPVLIDTAECPETLMMCRRDRLCDRAKPRLLTKAGPGLYGEDPCLMCTKEFIGLITISAKEIVPT